jgi:putative hydrolase of the HAD superfamily
VRALRGPLSGALDATILAWASGREYSWASLYDECTMSCLPATLLLDLDDTILDATGERDRCWRLACEEAAVRHARIDASALYAEIESTREAFWADAVRHREWRQKMRQAWQRIANDSLARLGVNDETIGVEIGNRHYELRESLRAPFPGAIETLGQLRERGVILGLITNGDGPGQRAKIEQFALAPYFAYVGIEGEVGHGKPHRQAYEAALVALDGEPHTTWMVGDNLEWDVEGAQAVGILGIWLDRHGTGLPERSAVKPDRVVRAIADLMR